jgi:hypothetical protein
MTTLLIVTGSLVVLFLVWNYCAGTVNKRYDESMDAWWTRQKDGDQ